VPPKPPPTDRQQAACDLTVKSLVTLTGLGETELRKLLQSGKATLPQPAEFAVDSLPVALLAQRPDLAASERELAAASADIGFFEPSVSAPVAARQPRIDKTHSAATPTTVITKPCLRPVAVAAAVQWRSAGRPPGRAQARYEQALARYRKAVRGAVEEVESLLSTSTVRRNAPARSMKPPSASPRMRTPPKKLACRGLSQLALEEARRFKLAAERNEITVQARARAELDRPLQGIGRRLGCTEHRRQQAFEQIE